MGKILEYSSLGAPPADDDLLFLGDYSVDNANPATKRLLISDLNKKRNVDAADGNGLMLRDDGGNYGIFIKDGGNVGIGTNAPDYELDISATNPTLGITAGAAGDAIIRFDQTTTQQATIGYDDTGDLLKFNNNSNFGGTSHLVINSDGNVGIGVANPTVSLDVSGDFEIVKGSYGVKIDSSNANIEGITSGGASGPLHLNRGGGEDIWFMYGSGTNIAGKIESGNRHWFIGTPANDAETTHARLHVKEDNSTTNPVLKLNNATTSAARTVVEFAITSGTDQFIVSENGRIGIRDTNAALGSDSVNFSGGKISIGSTTFNRKFNVTDSNNVLSEFSSSSVAGAKVLVRTTGTAGTDASNIHQNAIVGFPFVNSAAAGKVGWLAGSFLKGTSSYFGIHYSDAAYTSSSNDANLVFNNTLNNNLVHINTDGDVHVKRNVRADGYFNISANAGADPGAGNYCRGRFIQTFVSNLHMYDAATPSYVGALNFGQAGGAGATTMIPGSTLIDTASYGTKRSGAVSSVAPFAGKLLRVQLLPSATYAEAGYFAFYSDNTPITISSKPSSADMAFKQFTTSSFVEDTVFGLSDSDFTDSNSMLEFAAGDFLTFFLDPTGSAAAQAANLQVVSTFEFYVTDI